MRLIMEEPGAMLNIVTKPCKTLGKFLARFEHLFSKSQFGKFTAYTTSLLLDHSRFSIQEAWNKTPDMTYRKLQRFLSLSKWNVQELNNARVAVLESNRTTKSTRDGVVAIDDTNCHKKWAFKTEGARHQYSTTERGTVRGVVGVTSAFCSSRKHYPVNHVPYKPMDDFPQADISSFKSKIDIAVDLVDDAISKGIAFSDFVFDTWYAGRKLIDHIEDLGKTWITEFDSDRKISLHGKWERADGLVKLIPSDRFRKVTVPNSAGEDRSFWCYTSLCKEKGLRGKKKIVVAIGRWDPRDPKNVHVFATNHLRLTSEQVVRKYSLRWKVECLYRELKDSFYFDHFQVRTLFRIDRHWHLSLLVHAFLYWVKCNGYFAKQSPDKIETLSEFKRAFNSLNTADSLAWVAKNNEKFLKYLKQNRKRVY